MNECILTVNPALYRPYISKIYTQERVSIRKSWVHNHCIAFKIVPIYLNHFLKSILDRRIIIIRRGSNREPWGTNGMKNQTDRVHKFIAWYKIKKNSAPDILKEHRTSCSPKRCSSPISSWLGNFEIKIILACSLAV